MEDIQMVKTDQGAVNARILAKEAKADFRRVEAASLKMRTNFTSAEAKRLFVRMFNTLQLNAHFISVIARTRIEHQDIEKVEASLRADIDAAKDALNQALDGAEALFKANGIGSYATYDTQPLVIEVPILSSSGRRYLEVLNQFDQLMPLLQTLEIHEVITTQALDIQRASLKRRIKDIANTARRLATGLRRRMNAMAGRDNDRGPDRVELQAAGSATEGGMHGSVGSGAGNSGYSASASASTSAEAQSAFTSDESAVPRGAASSDADDLAPQDLGVRVEKPYRAEARRASRKAVDPALAQTTTDAVAGNLHASVAGMGEADLPGSDVRATGSAD